MKKIVLLAASAATMLFISCESCGGCGQECVVIESDSLSAMNDSTLSDVQTFVFEGESPMNGNAVANVLLAVSTVNLNSDGTYTVTTDYVDEGLATQSDNGDALIILGSGNDSTATFIELVSANNIPTMNFLMTEDSSLVKVDKDGKPASNNPNHKLTIKK